MRVGVRYFHQRSVIELEGIRIFNVLRYVFAAF